MDIATTRAVVSSKDTWLAPSRAFPPNMRMTTKRIADRKTKGIRDTQAEGKFLVDCSLDFIYRR